MAEYRMVDLGAATSDAEKVTLSLRGGDLTLAFVDWQETPRQLVFRGVLGFRWQQSMKRSWGTPFATTPHTKYRARLGSIARPSYRGSEQTSMPTTCFASMR